MVHLQTRCTPVYTEEEIYAEGVGMSVFSTEKMDDKHKILRTFRKPTAKHGYLRVMATCSQVAEETFNLEMTRTCHGTINKL